MVYINSTNFIFVPTAEYVGHFIVEKYLHFSRLVSKSCPEIYFATATFQIAGQNDSSDLFFYTLDLISHVYCI